MKKHANIPIFIPHLGCPNQCVFCNQRTITGVEEFSPRDAEKIIEEALATIEDGVECEIAFFGGSFTGIDRTLMCELLKTAHSYVVNGRVMSIRCSTRPDYINQEILDILKRYGVKVIELGLQSARDYVLDVTKRGHTFKDEEIACRLIVDNGFALVGQMMIGLPGSDEDSEEETARFIVSSGAKAARIYPTVVFKNTELYFMAETGLYKPLVESEAIERSARVLKILRDGGVEVIRIGLCASENLSDETTYYAGPNHPALGELVENQYFYNKIKEKISRGENAENKDIIVYVGCGSLSKAIGQKKTNRLRLISEYPSSHFFFKERADVAEYDVEVEFEERKKRCI